MTIVRVIVFFICLSFKSHALELSWGQLPLDDEFNSSSRDGKPTLVFIHASWCSYCHKLKDEVFTDSQVKDKMTEYHLVSVDGDDKSVGSEYFKSIKGRGFPTTIFYDSLGKEIDRLVGYLSSGAFLDLLNANLSQKNIFDVLEEELSQAKKSRRPAIRYKIIEKQFDMGLWDEVLKSIRSYSAHPSYAKYAFDLKLMRGIIYSKQKNYTMARLYLKVAWDSATNESQYMDAVRWLARLFRKTKQPEKRLAVFQAAIDKYGSISAYNGYAWNASKTKTNLDQALDYALKAVELSKRKIGILDTLAAVHFARREYTEALRISREILATKPESGSYAKRHKKYLNAFRKFLMQG
ncbi:MAG: thioredoxin fold domain-containing protein [bacterium]|nr:thioredoxin fold domain-containing protein [bacterium]